MNEVGSPCVHGGEKHTERKKTNKKTQHSRLRSIRTRQRTLKIANTRPNDMPSTTQHMHKHTTRNNLIFFLFLFKAARPLGNIPRRRTIHMLRANQNTTKHIMVSIGLKLYIFVFFSVWPPLAQKHHENWTDLVFIENHPFENFSPRTLLVFMENHGFEL